MYSFASSSADTTRQLGRKLGALLQAGDCICLQGDLGAGKTTLVQGIAAGWGARDEVSSPTFVLVNVYRRAPGIEAVETDAEALFHSTPTASLLPPKPKNWTWRRCLPAARCSSNGRSASNPSCPQKTCG